MRVPRGRGWGWPGNRGRGARGGAGTGLYCFSSAPDPGPDGFVVGEGGAAALDASRHRQSVVDCCEADDNDGGDIQAQRGNSDSASSAAAASPVAIPNGNHISRLINFLSSNGLFFPVYM